MRFSEVLWEVVGSDGFVDGHYGLMVRSWRLSCWVLAMWFHLSLLSPARFLYKEQYFYTRDYFVQSQVIGKVRTALQRVALSRQVCGYIHFSFFPQMVGLSLCNVDPSYSISFVGYLAASLP